MWRVQSSSRVGQEYFQPIMMVFSYRRKIVFTCVEQRGCYESPEYKQHKLRGVFTYIRLNFDKASPPTRVDQKLLCTQVSPCPLATLCVPLVIIYLTYGHGTLQSKQSEPSHRWPQLHQTTKFAEPSVYVFGT